MTIVKTTMDVVNLLTPFQHNRLEKMNDQIKKQIDTLTVEISRVKQFVNENNFDCTTAPYVLVKQYRDALKAHVKLLMINYDESPN